MSAWVRLAALGPGSLDSPSLPGGALAPLAGRLVYVYQRNTSFTAAVSPNPDGSGAPLAQPVQADNYGNLPGYVQSGTSIDLYDTVTQTRMQLEPLSASDIVTAEGLAAREVHAGQHGPNGILAVDGSYTLANGTGVKLGDGNGHTLADVYSTLAAAQVVYPFATALTMPIDTAAATAALNALPVDATGAATKLGRLRFAAGQWVIDNVHFDNTSITVQGEPGATWFVPGPSGTVGSSTQTGGQKYGMAFDGIWFGDQITPGNPVVDRPYSVPLFSFTNNGQNLFLRNGGLRLSGTGTGFHFTDSYVGGIEDFYFQTGYYGVPAVFDGVGGPDDTITWDKAVVAGFYGPIFRHVSGALATVQLESYKQTCVPNGAQSGQTQGRLDHSLANWAATLTFANASTAVTGIAVTAGPALVTGMVIGIAGTNIPAGTTLTITGAGTGTLSQPSTGASAGSYSFDPQPGATTFALQAGQGAAWAAGKDMVYIEGNYADDNAAGRICKGVEVNQVMAVNGDALTVKQPLQFAHGTNGGAFHVQVLHGAIGPTFPDNVYAVRINGHIEGAAWACMAAQVRGLVFDNFTHASEVLVRIIDNCKSVEFRGRMEVTGHPSTSANAAMYDIPAWNAQSPSFVVPGASPAIAATSTVTLTQIEYGVETAYTPKNYELFTGGTNAAPPAPVQRWLYPGTYRLRASGGGSAGGGCAAATVANQAPCGGGGAGAYEEQIVTLTQAVQVTITLGAGGQGANGAAGGTGGDTTIAGGAGAVALTAKGSNHGGGASSGANTSATAPGTYGFTGIAPGAASAQAPGQGGAGAVAGASGVGLSASGGGGGGPVNAGQGGGAGLAGGGTPGGGGSGTSGVLTGANGQSAAVNSGGGGGGAGANANTGGPNKGGDGGSGWASIERIYVG